ncbi:PTPLA-domain-containing protein [Eremomyces bilateralis CBS 781.70]|uniref:Very-long-chain (3R)-3-hydroxyacyl-CoA dehydratase n=1 Tax=Eremomyces bilateralis CBS 781.70 TaxID=1392243 RepID=A0A6G1GCI3_9PEZI|nr:PTPLA-domain-containing protein [Eremomyces bilateralis CBS 781.70]KAF1815743.1 PTPLA-domain-containing protein [Eremomyces bilateralis CBS 781.70]
MATTYKTAYLQLYNFLSLLAWFAVLVRVVLITQVAGWRHVYEVNEEFVRWTQSAMMLEIGHVLFGFVRSALLTTLIQIGSRILLVWPIAYWIPSATSTNPFYVTMLLAWSITEVVRYAYFVFQLSGRGVPGFIQGLRYNTFFILYPLGIVSECACIYSAIADAGNLHPALPAALYAILAIYVPGSYVMYTHMMKQRRKAARGKQKI